MFNKRKKNILIIKTETTNSEELVVPVFIVYMFYFLCRLSAILCNKFLNLFASWHHAESTLAGSDKRCACVCEGKHFHQVLVGEVFQTVLQNIVQDAGTEGVRHLWSQWCAPEGMERTLHGVPCNKRGFRLYPV